VKKDHQNLISTIDIILRFSLLKIDDMYSHSFFVINDNMLIIGIGAGTELHSSSSD
jgi:hypothetical protein